MNCPVQFDHLPPELNEYIFAFSRAYGVYQVHKQQHLCPQSTVVEADELGLIFLTQQSNSIIVQGQQYWLREPIQSVQKTYVLRRGQGEIDLLWFEPSKLRRFRLPCEHKPMLLPELKLTPKSNIYCKDTILSVTTEDYIQVRIYIPYSGSMRLVRQMPTQAVNAWQVSSGNTNIFLRISCPHVLCIAGSTNLEMLAMPNWLTLSEIQGLDIAHQGNIVVWYSHALVFVDLCLMTSKLYPFAQPLHYISMGTNYITCVFQNRKYMRLQLNPCITIKP